MYLVHFVNCCNVCIYRNDVLSAVTRKACAALFCIPTFHRSLCYHVPFCLLCRPKAYYLCDLIDYFYRCMRWDRILISYINPLFLYVNMAELFFMHFMLIVKLLYFSYTITRICIHCQQCPYRWHGNCSVCEI